MEMYCENCHAYFDEEETLKIYDDPSPSGVSLPSGQIVIDELCPYCHSSFIDEANTCDCCGYHIRPDEKLCEDCAELAESMFTVLRKEINRVQKNEPNKNMWAEGVRDFLIDRIEYLYS